MPSSYTTSWDLTWLERSYHRQPNRETGKTPLERFGSGGPPRYASAAELREAFLWCERRSVAKTATVSLHGNRYEVDAALVGRTVELLFDPYSLGEIEVRYGGRSFGSAVAHQVGRHVHPRAEPELPAKAPRTGIDYLALLAHEHEQALRRQIAYRELPPDEREETR